MIASIEITCPKCGSLAVVDYQDFPRFDMSCGCELDIDQNRQVFLQIVDKQSLIEVVENDLNPDNHITPGSSRPCISS